MSNIQQDVNIVSTNVLLPVNVNGYMLAKINIAVTYNQLSKGNTNNIMLYIYFKNNLDKFVSGAPFSL